MKADRIDYYANQLRGIPVADLGRKVREVLRDVWNEATTAERNRTDSAINSLTRADYRPSGIWRHYYPSTSGDWVCLSELKKAMRSNAALTERGEKQ